MNPDFESIILESAQATGLFEMGVLQKLWSGYGQIVRYGLKGSHLNSVIVKHVQLPKQSQHPRGWNTDISHQRKLKSYQVEMAWYRNWSERCGEYCRVPHCLAVTSKANEVFIVLEDLDAAGFNERRTYVTADEMHACLSWLAHFHANFLHETPTDLWETGTYWHLATRPDELNALEDLALKKAAADIDEKLKATFYQTLVHGDAKLANFCFAPEKNAVAAVDFQYVGGGCGMKDVAYFMGSCLDETACEQQAPPLLDAYFQYLKDALTKYGKDICAEAIEADWRALYPIAWADFHRFLKGWSPGHWKIHSYSERLAAEVIQQIKIQKP